MTTTANSMTRPTDALQIRTVMANVPTSVAVVAGDSGERAAMVVGSFVSVSLEPVLAGFFVDRSSTSWPKMRNADVLGISVLSSRQLALCDKIGRKHEDRFDDRYWEKGAFGAPLLPEAASQFEGRINTVSAAGDHDLVLVEVIGFSGSENCRPLVFHNRRFVGLADL